MKARTCSPEFWTARRRLRCRPWFPRSASCIVFIPMFFLTGVARYLLIPLAEAVVFAMLASYASLTHAGADARDVPAARAFAWRLVGIRSLAQSRFSGVFQRLRLGMNLLLTSLVYRRYFFVPAFLAVCGAAFFLVPWLGRDFFPDTDSGQFRLHVRAKAGTAHPDGDGCGNQRRHSGEAAGRIWPATAVSMRYSNNGVIGSEDADILVSLKQEHHPTNDYVRKLRRDLSSNTLASRSTSCRPTWSRRS